MASARSSCKDLLERIPPGSPQNLLLRTCAGSCQDLLERDLEGSPGEPVHPGIYSAKQNRGSDQGGLLKLGFLIEVSMGERRKTGANNVVFRMKMGSG